MYVKTSAFFCFNVFRRTILLFILLSSTIFSCKKQSKSFANHESRADGVIDKSNTLLKEGKFKMALRYLDSAYLADSLASPEDLWKKYNFLTNYYINYQVDTTAARTYADSMSVVVQGRNDLKTETAYTFFAHADVLMAEKKYAEAFTQYYHGRGYAETNLDTCELAPFSNQLGLVKYRQTKFREAIAYIKQGLRENAHCRDFKDFKNQFYLPQDMLNTLALCYEQLSLRDSAIFYYRKNLELIAIQEPRFPAYKIDVTRARGVAYGNLGGVYAYLGQFDQARYYLTESIRLNNRPGYEINDAIAARIKLAYLYISLHKYAEAATEIRYLKNQLSALNLKTAGGYLLQLNLYKLTWDYYDKVNDIDQAYRYQQKFYAFSDSVKKVNREMREADMDGTFKRIENQYQLDSLSKDDQLKTFYLTAIVIFSLLICGLLLVSWRNLKRIRIANKKISSKNREISLQNEQINKQNSDMRQALNALEQSQADNSRIMKIVAHDLRNPIGGIKMAASLISRKLGDQAEDFQMLDVIKRSADNSLALVDELLQMNTHTEELKRDAVDLRDLLDYCVAQLRHKADAKNQQIRLIANPLTVQLDGGKIWRVFSNLIANAIKFSAAGSAIVVRLKKNSQSVLITVQDQGIGIPADLTDKIFDVFTTAKRKGTEGEQPFGLGLAISKQIVTAHGGKIWFESFAGTGTTFYVELPDDEDNVATVYH